MNVFTVGTAVGERPCHDPLRMSGREQLASTPTDRCAVWRVVLLVGVQVGGTMVHPNPLRGPPGRTLAFCG